MLSTPALFEDRSSFSHSVSRLKEIEESHQTEERKRKELEAENARLLAEKQAVLLQLEQERDESAEIEERSAKLLAQKADIEKQ
ncbi:hypothetical protein TELCIR_20831, partial [Teladorsagia circumcincta]